MVKNLLLQSPIRKPNQEKLVFDIENFSLTALKIS